MSIYDVPVRELLKRFIAETGINPGQSIPKRTIVDWFRANYPKIKTNTVNAQIITATTNSRTRTYYGADSRHDLFFQTDSGHLRLYDQNTDPTPIYSSVSPSDHDEDPAADESPVGDTRSDEFAYESDLKNFLASNLNRIEPGLTLYNEIEGISGIEFPVGGRYVDILATDSSGNFVVIELKVSRGYDRVVGQLLRYIGWIRKNLATNGKRVRGIIIASSISEDLLFACSHLPDVTLYEYHLSVTLDKVNLLPEAACDNGRVVSGWQ
jgi:hypothetical protein